MSLFKSWKLQVGSDSWAKPSNLWKFPGRRTSPQLKVAAATYGAASLRIVAHGSLRIIVFPSGEGLKDITGVEGVADAITQVKKLEDFLVFAGEPGRMGSVGH